MTGWIKIERESFGHDMFEADEFSRRDAWFWLIARAAWKPMRTKIKGYAVDLERGELSASVREMAEAWKWSKSRVNRFMAELREAEMISVRARSGTTLGQRSSQKMGQTLGQQNYHAAGQGKSIINICNYAKYQLGQDDGRDNEIEISGTNSGTNFGTRFSENLGQHNKEEEYNNNNNIYNNNNIPQTRARIREGGLDLGDEPKSAKTDQKRYAFSGNLIRLNAKDFARWKGLFRAIPDLEVELTLLDAHYAKCASKGEDVSDWFFRAQRALGNKHQERLERRQEQRQPDMASAGFAPPPTRYSYGADDE